MLRETGTEVREEVRQKLPGNKPDEVAEEIWVEALTGNKEFNAAVVGEEGTYTVEEDSDYAFLVDPVDGTSGAVNGEFPWITTAVTVLENVEVYETGLTGEPIGSFIRQINGNGAEFFSWEGEASINGEVRFTDIDYEESLPRTVDEVYIGPRELKSFSDLKYNQKGLVSAYAANKARRPVREGFHNKMENLSENVRLSLAGGSYLGASVGWGKTLVAGEPIPTVPTEAAGEVFARAMGAESSNIYGDENDTLTVRKEKTGISMTYTTIVAANEQILREVLESINVEGLEKTYTEEFKMYKRAIEIYAKI